MTNNQKHLYSDHWDGENYKRVSSPQFSINMKFIGQFTFKGNESVLDIGCGNGDTTREIAKQVPRGHVVGIDASLSMIEEAQRTQLRENLRFEVLNAQDVNFEREFDIVTAFFCMQWVQDKIKVFRDINNALRSNGKFMMIAPMPHPCLPQIRNKLMAKTHWVSYFVAYQDPLIFINDNDYAGYARHAGMQVEKAVIEHDPVCFSGYDSFFDFMYEMTPHLNRLPNEDLKNAFIHELLEEYLAIYPKSVEGECRLDFNLQKMVCSS